MKETINISSQHPPSLSRMQPREGRSPSDGVRMKSEISANVFVPSSQQFFWKKYRFVGAILKTMYKKMH